jgi:LAS superfamily LD-carboxypeptidase LdcB
MGPRVCSVPTAKPGNSNHGWGRAVDIKVAGRLLTCDSEAFHWLQDNAHLYGWVHPGWAACGENKQEAWHWEWGGTRKSAPVVIKLRNIAV